MDNFHASHSAVDGRTGRKFRARRDASVIGAGNNFGGHELSVPTYVVKLTKQSGRTGTATINAKARQQTDSARPLMNSFTF